MAEDSRVALVTGANKGIGLEIARQLAQAGIRVITGAREDSRASAAVDDLASQGLMAQSVRLDLDDAQSITAAAATIAAEHGKLDILVNNAGIFDTADGPPATASLAAVRRVMRSSRPISFSPLCRPAFTIDADCASADHHLNTRHVSWTLPSPCSLAIMRRNRLRRDGTRAGAPLEPGKAWSAAWHLQPASIARPIPWARSQIPPTPGLPTTSCFAKVAIRRERSEWSSCSSNQDKVRNRIDPKEKIYAQSRHGRIE